MSDKTLEIILVVGITLAIAGTAIAFAGLIMAL